VAGHEVVEVHGTEHARPGAPSHVVIHRGVPDTSCPQLRRRVLA
jgi:hypothetical protein